MGTKRQVGRDTGDTGIPTSLRLLRIRWPWLLLAGLIGAGFGYLVAERDTGGYLASVPLQPVFESEQESSEAVDVATDRLVFEMGTDVFLGRLRSRAGEGITRVVVSAPDEAHLAIATVRALTPEEAEAGALAINSVFADLSGGVLSSREDELSILKARLERYGRRISTLTQQLRDVRDNRLPPTIETTVDELMLVDQIARRADVIDQIDTLELEMRSSGPGFEAFALGSVEAQPDRPLVPVVMSLSGVVFVLLTLGVVVGEGRRGIGAAVPALLKPRFNLPVIDLGHSFEVSVLAARVTRNRFRGVAIVAADSATTTTLLPVVAELANAIRASGFPVVVIDQDETTTQLDPPDMSTLLDTVDGVGDVCLLTCADPNLIPESAQMATQVDAFLVVTEATSSLGAVRDVIEHFRAAGFQPLAIGYLPRTPEPSHVLVTKT